MQEIIDDVVLELIREAQLTPVGNDYYNGSIERIEVARQEINQLAADLVSPGLHDLINLASGKTKMADFVDWYQKRMHQLNVMLRGYEDAVSGANAFALEHAYTEGVKAGFGLVANFKSWIED